MLLYNRSLTTYSNNMQYLDEKEEGNDLEVLVMHVRKFQQLNQAEGGKPKDIYIIFHSLDYKLFIKQF